MINLFQNNYFSSGGIQDSYLLNSLFQESINMNSLTDDIFSFDQHLSKFSGNVYIFFVYLEEHKYQ